MTPDGSVVKEESLREELLEELQAMNEIVQTYESLSPVGKQWVLNRLKGEY